VRASESHPSRGLPGNKAVNPYRRTVETSKTSKSSASDEKAPLIDVEVKEIIGCKEPILIDLCTEDSRCSLGSDRKEVVRLSIEPVNDVFSDQCDEVKTPDGSGAMMMMTARTRPAATSAAQSCTQKAKLRLYDQES
jgi:hypothetical protein